MLEIMELIAQQGPTVIAVDDLHWADSASAEFLVHLFQLADHLPVLFLCSFRPHHTSPAWMLKQAAEINYAHRYTQINLSPLSGSESNQMIDQLLGGAGLPDDIQRMILMKSEGNPFFMEEVVRGLIDEKKISRDQSNGKWHWNASVEGISIPDNLHSVLTARIDRLEETAKHVLQMASVVGRSFYYQVLEIVNDATDELDKELINMQRMGLILEVTRDPDIEYIFRQALTHETAYNTILLKHRREYHCRVGEALLQLFPERVEEFSSLLAHHFYQGRDPRALEYFKMKGDAAFRLYANVEAIDSYSKAIEVAKWDDDLDLEMLSDLYACLGRAYELNSEFTLALEIYKDLENLAVKLQDNKVELTALISQALIYSVPSSQFNLELGMSIVHKAQKTAEELDEREALAKIYWISMNLNRFNQSPKDAQDDGVKAIALARELNLEEQLAYSLNDTAHAYSMNGQMDRAREVSLEAAELWQKLDNLPMLADSLAGLAAISVYSGEFDLAYEYSDKAYQISQSIDNVWGQSYSRYSIGLVDFERGNVDLAFEHFEQTIRDARISKFTAGELLSRTFLSVAYAELGQSQMAIEVVEKKFDPEMENLAVARAFFLGASLLAHVRAGNLEKAEEIMEQFRDGLEGGYFIARHYFVLGQCYYYLATGEYETTLKLSSEFLLNLRETGIVFLNAELLLIMGIAYINLGMFSDAKAKLDEATKFAEQLGSRKSQWQIDYYKGVCLIAEGEQHQADKYFARSMETFEYILDHIEDPEMKAVFRSKKEAVDLVGKMEKIEELGE
jgi:predicted ATPase